MRRRGEEKDRNRTKSEKKKTVGGSVCCEAFTASTQVNREHFTFYYVRTQRLDT